MLEVSLAGAAKEVGEFRPGIGRTHIHDAHRAGEDSPQSDAPVEVVPCAAGVDEVRASTLLRG
jgi:hypothetical protein